jgi:hypothetical protein
MEKISRAERKEKARKKREFYGELIIETYFNYQAQFETADYCLKLTNMFIDKLIKENPQESELIRTACREVNESFKFLNDYIKENASNE